MALGTSWTQIASDSFTYLGYSGTAYVYAKLNRQDTANRKSYVDLELRINHSVWVQSYDTDFYLSGSGWLGYAYREYSAGTTTIMSSQITVTHNSNGVGSFTATGGYEYKGIGVSATQFTSSSQSLPNITVNYTISYNANGGTGAPGNQTKTHGTALTLSSTVPTWSGHTFSGWNTAQNGTGTMYQPGGSYTANASATLYAQWGLVSYTITYNANNGTGAPDPSTKVHGQTTYLSTVTPERDGYTFFKWNTLANGTGQDYSPGGPFNIDAATTLYAIWIQNTVPVDSVHDCVIKIHDNWIPCFSYINVGGTWYFVRKTAINVSGTWRNVSNKT